MKSKTYDGSISAHDWNQGIMNDVEILVGEMNAWHEWTKKTGRPSPTGNSNIIVAVILTFRD